jgi:Sec-independent protein translocase protein TatA
MRPCLALFQNIGLAEILILAVAGVLLFGSSLPEVARNAARTIKKWREFWQDASADFRRELSGDESEPARTPQPSAFLPGTPETVHRAVRADFSLKSTENEENHKMQEGEGK